MASSHVLGVDFGTCNSYFCKCPDDLVQPSSIDFGTGTDGLATAILYREGREPLVGHEALHEWGEATDQERGDYRLRTHFKPDIAVSGEARTCARDFFAAVLAQWERRHVEIKPAERQVLVGVPSEAMEAFRNALADLADEAGYGRIRMVDEPVAALLHHVQHRDLSPQQAHQGVLVVDFGGGTCDFAYMCRLEVRHSWGDMWLGGRLFDDMFFQWFLEQNADAPARLDAANAEYFVHWHECRETKEFFSRTMARDRTEVVRKRLGPYGLLRDLTWEGFRDRAARYRPTPEFTRHLREAACPVQALVTPDGGVDLLGWFRDRLEEGLEANHIRPDEVERVLLTGGSSQWPFVPDVLREVLHIDPDDPQRILRSDRPYVAIGEGLAMLPAVQHEFEQTRRRLQAELPALLEGEIDPLVEEAVDQALELVSEDVATELFDDRIRGILQEYRERGGSAASLRHRIETAVAGFEQRARAIVQRHMALIEKGVPQQVGQCVAAWLGGFNLHYSAQDARMGGIECPEVFGAMPVRAPEFYTMVADGVGSIVALITGYVAANICGGAGVALIMSGPVGWAVGAIVGLSSAGLSVSYGRGFARRLTEGWNVPPEVTIPLLRKKLPILKAFLTQGKLERILSRGRQKFHARLTADMRAQLAGPLQELKDRIRELVRGQVDSLSAIDQLGT